MSSAAPADPIYPQDWTSSLFSELRLEMRDGFTRLFDKLTDMGERLAHLEAVDLKDDVKALEARVNQTAELSGRLEERVKFQARLWSVISSVAVALVIAVLQKVMGL